MDEGKATPHPTIETGLIVVGGVLGMFCAHAYPTTSNLAQILLPQALKGADLALYSSFESLGLEVEILPVLEDEEGYFTTNGGSSYYSYGDSGYMAYLEKGELRNMNYSELLPSSTFCAEVDRRWKLLMLTRQVQGMTDALDFADRKGLPKNPGQSFYEMEGAYVGSCRHPYKAYDRQQDEDFDSVSFATNTVQHCSVDD